MSLLPGLNQGLTNCAGAEVQLLPDGTFNVRLVKISLSKKLVHIDVKKAFPGSSDKISKEPILEPLAITLTGKGVLIKKTARLESVNEQSLQHLFPTLKLAEFYVQHFAAGAHSFVAIIRRETADAVIAAFKKLGTEVLMLSLGPFTADQVIPQINMYGNNLKFDGHSLILDAEGHWQEYSYTADIKADFPIKVDIEVIPEEFLIAYATSFQLLLNDKLDLITVEAEDIAQNLMELTAKLKFKKFGTLMLGFFFVLLMVNFLLLSMYNSSNEELMGKAGQQTYIAENSQKLQEEVKGKENLVKKLGWNKGLAYAYLCDQIGSSMPKEVLLHELQINPLSGAGIGNITDSQPEVGNIKIKGQTNSVYAINNWIYVLKEKPWVKDVQLQKYTADDQKEVQVFTILLNY